MTPEDPNLEKSSKRKSVMFQLNKWKNFFFEFLMIFLGVTAGFFVDEYRQEREERSDEVHYINAYLIDLEKDRIALENNSEFGKITILGHDSLSKELLKTPLQGREKKLYHYLNLQNTGFGIPHHDRTISQLKFSGKFRIIENQRVADALVDYDTKVVGAKGVAGGRYKQDIANNTLIDIAKVFDLTQGYTFAKESLLNKEDYERVNYPPDLKLLSYDRQTIQQLRNTLIQSRQMDVMLLNINNHLLDENRKLDSLIRREYFE